MSFVVCLATSSFGIMMSDGRVTDGDNITNENYQKFIRLPNDLIIGYAGDALFCTTCIALSFHGKKIEGINIDSAFQMINNTAITLLNDSRLTKFIKSMFLFLGRNQNGALQISTMQIIGKEFEKHHFIPNGSIDIKYACAGTDAVNDPEILLASSIHSKGGRLIDGLAEAIRVVSTIDNSVNDHVFYESIGTVPDFL